MDKLGKDLAKHAAKILQLNSQLKVQEQHTNEKYKIILKFAQDVYKIVQTRNDKDYKQGLMHLNQNYVMSDAAYTESGKKQDMEEIQELDKNLRYKERTIATLKINAIKQEDRDKNEIKKKTKENTYLVVELNNIKFEEKMLKCEIMKQKQLKDDLEIEINQKRKQLAQDLIDAKQEAAMMLQTHNISPGKDGVVIDQEDKMLSTNKSQSNS